MSKYPQAMGKSILYKAGSEICKACTNSSTAKYQYSFSRSPRFGFGDAYKSLKEQRLEEKKRREEEEEKIKNKQYVKHDFYSLPSTLDKRFTRFGYGKKVDFTAGRRYDIGKSATLTDKTREEILEKIKNEVILKEPEGIKEKKKYYFSLMGSNFPSKFRSNEGITICERHKPKDLRDDNPGPGAYIMPSEFGIYQKEDPDRYKYEKKEEEDPKPWRHGMKKIKPKEEAEDYGGGEDIGGGDDGNQDNENNDQGNQEENQDNQDNQENKDNQDNQEENKNEENEHKNENEEDKESECIMLRDMLMYKKKKKNENANANENS